MFNSQLEEDHQEERQVEDGIPKPLLKIILQASHQTLIDESL